MSRAAFEIALASMDPSQLEAVRICIMAERRLRDLFPRTLPKDTTALEDAYSWALTARADLMINSTARKRA